MNRTDKRTILKQVLQGQLNGLRALEQQQTPTIFFCDQMPDEHNNLPVQVRYTRNGSQRNELLTYAQMVAKSPNLITIILPAKHSHHES